MMPPYYYLTLDGELVESSARFDDIRHAPIYTQLNELQFAIAKLMISGYSRTEITLAVHEVASLLPKNKEG